jgi:hypothetical protein
VKKALLPSFRLSDSQLLRALSPAPARRSNILCGYGFLKALAATVR